MISNAVLKQKVLESAIHGTLVNNLQVQLKDKYLKYVSKNSMFEVPNNWKWVNLDSICKLIFSAPSPKVSYRQDICLHHCDMKDAHEVCSSQRLNKVREQSKQVFEFRL